MKHRRVFVWCEWTAARPSAEFKKRQRMSADRTTALCAALLLLFDSTVVHDFKLNFTHDASEGRAFSPVRHFGTVNKSVWDVSASVICDKNTVNSFTFCFRNDKNLSES